MSFFGGRRRSLKRKVRTRARKSRLGKSMKSVDQLVGLPFGAVGLKKPVGRIFTRLGVTLGGKKRRKSHKKKQSRKRKSSCKK